MKIAYVINSVEGGGAASPVPRVAATLRRHGADLRVMALAPRDRRGLAAIEAAGLDIIVREGGDTDHAAALAWLNGQVRAYRPDLLWTSLTRATLLGQMVGTVRRIPVVSWQHAAFLKPLNLALLRRTQHLTRLWVADSRAVAEFARDRLGVAPSRLATWPLFQAEAEVEQSRPWQPGDTIRLGMLGRLHPVKGHGALIAALARLRAEGFVAPAPVDLAIAGEGQLRGELTAQVRAAGLAESVRFIGFIERPRAFMAGLHLYLQPSRSEGLCIAAHEAMQAALPTIVSAVGEMANSVVDGVTGRLVPPDDVNAFAAALRDMLSTPARLATMGAAARARVLGRFGPAAFAAAGDEVIARLPRAPIAA